MLSFAFRRTKHYCPDGDYLYLEEKTRTKSEEKLLPSCSWAFQLKTQAPATSIAGKLSNLEN